ncbi:hypothetical protein SEA_AEGEUS_50 [Mycobacterium phage Aegeus]|nr:hypothetical protein SEA_BAUDELAIRE_50 [Mycobacterium phage Baudelaire]WKW86542.1 hypothetical protein SEA_AEGEUS_50 [Mycobacterium phage Aegeus]
MRMREAGIWLPHPSDLSNCDCR